jgi:hypothetical protein
MSWDQSHGLGKADEEWKIDQTPEENPGWRAIF